ncbi:MAG: ABC transporter permease [Anaerolineales bacterium]|nr:ABC transporter permease [Anaerolineales bacterium]
MRLSLKSLRSWEGLLLVILIAVVALNIALSPVYLGVGNFINLFQLSIEKIIVALIMAFVIINGEIDLSVASVMGFAACVVAVVHENNALPFAAAVALALVVGALAGLVQGYFVAHMGLPSLAVTLAGLIGFRGMARMLVEDRSIGDFPEWFNALGQKPLLGPIPLALLIFVGMAVIAVIVLQSAAFGRYVTVIGNNADVARYSGIDVKRVKLSLFVLSGLVAALAGVLLAARLGAVRASTGEGFELDIITMVLLGGVSIFGGSGSLVGVGLSILIILNMRNGLGLANVEANTQTGIIGALLILSVLVPNLVNGLRRARVGRAGHT